MNKKYVNISCISTYFKVNLSKGERQLFTTTHPQYMYVDGEKWPSRSFAEVNMLKITNYNIRDI